MKIAIAVVLGGDLVRSTEHLGVSYIVSYLQQFNYRCDIIKVYDMNDEDTIGQLKNNSYDVLGFTTTCVNMKQIKEVAQIIKESNKNTHITFGGHMATFWGKKILEDYSCVDSIIRGEGEITFYDLVRSIDQKIPFTDIDGLSFRSNGKIVENKDRALIQNLDNLPFPVRNQFDAHDNRFQYLRICSSRGCMGNCGFCSSFVGRTQKDYVWRGRSPENVVAEIEELVQKYDFHTYDFVDSTFEDPGKEGKIRIRKIAELIIEKNLEIYYNCCFRAENWTDDDRELLSILIESGLEKVNIGFESGNDRGLQILHKKARMRHNKNIIRLLADFPEIYITFGFIMFHPYSILDDLKDNARFLYESGIGQVIRHYFWKLEVYPSTRIERQLLLDKRIKEDYDICDGMYEYQFIDDTVDKISAISQEMLKVREVWDFEIFDIIIHTYLTRMKRKYKQTNIWNALLEFEESVAIVRRDLARFNYEFFMEIFQTYMHYDIPQKQKQLIETIQTAMNSIRDKQLKLNYGLVKQGYTLVSKY